MTDQSQDRRLTMCAAALNAILDANRLEDGSIIIDADDTREALIIALATIIEAWPDLKSSRDIRLACESVANDLHEKVKLMREQFERSGHRPWDGAIVRPN